MQTAVERLITVIDEVGAEDLGAAPDAALLGRQHALELARRKLDAATATALGVAHQRGAAAYDGAITTKSWLTARLKMTDYEAHQWMTAVRHLAEWPVFAKDFQAGKVSLAGVLVAADLAKKVGPDHAEEALTALLKPARTMDPTNLKQVARRIQILIHPEKDDDPPPPNPDRNLYLAQTLGGWWDLAGRLDPETGSIAATYFATSSGKRDADDDRIPAERRHDSLRDVLALGLNSGDLPTANGEQPHLGVIVHARDLQKTPPGRKQRLKPTIHFEGEDLLAAMYSCLDDDLPPIAPAWLDEPDGGVLDATLDGGLLNATLDDGLLEATLDGNLPNGDFLRGNFPDWDLIAAAWANDPTTAETASTPQTTATPTDTSTLPTDSTLSPADPHATTAAGGQRDCPVPAARPWQPSRPWSDGPLDPAVFDARPLSDLLGLPDFDALPNAKPQSLTEIIEASYSGNQHSRIPTPGTGGVTDFGGILPSEAIRRIACDAGLHRIVFDQNDVPVNAGRRLRLPGPATRRVIIARDGGCRFHGCDRPPIWTQVHHVIHWADGGKTDVNNLLLLCGFHHHRVHDEGWTIAFDGREVTIHRPDGTLLPPP